MIALVLDTSQPSYEGGVFCLGDVQALLKVLGLYKISYVFCSIPFFDQVKNSFRGELGPLSFINLELTGCGCSSDPIRQRFIKIPIL